MQSMKLLPVQTVVWTELYFSLYHHMVPCSAEGPAKKGRPLFFLVQILDMTSVVLFGFKLTECSTSIPP